MCCRSREPRWSFASPMGPRHSFRDAGRTSMALRVPGCPATRRSRCPDRASCWSCSCCCASAFVLSFEPETGETIARALRANRPTEMRSDFGIPGVGSQQDGPPGSRNHSPRASAWHDVLSLVQCTSICPGACVLAAARPGLTRRTVISKANSFDRGRHRTERKSGPTVAGTRVAGSRSTHADAARVPALTPSGRCT